ncbi:hypothetical protein C1894_12475 [Pseudomonas sp. FW305-3-2-15-E-TSA2]|nr:hypothetical protein C1894_12475 [Pseudomonas sp. FW305-3-2-15-E-TSA2]
MGCWQFTAFDLTKHRPPCGSEPARESGVSVDIEVSGMALSRAGSLPQGLIIVRQLSGNNVQSTAAIDAR